MQEIILIDFIELILTYMMVVTVNDYTSIRENKNGSKITKYRNWILSIFFIYMFVFNTLGINPILNALINNIFIYLVAHTYRKSIIQNLFITLKMSILLFGIEIMIPFLFSLFLKESVDVLIKNEVIFLTMLIIARLATFTIAKVIKCLSRYSKTPNYDTPLFSEWGLIAIVPINSIILLCLISILSEKYSFISDVYITVFIIVLLISNISFFILYNKITEARSIEKENELLNKQVSYYNNHYEELNSQIKSNRILQHNLKYELTNILSKYEFMKSNQESLEPKLNNLLSDLFITDYNFYCNNPSIDMIINVEVSKAKNLGIDINTEISIDEDVHIDGKILCVIIGNILDNAIEACTIHDNKEILLKITQQNSNILITTKNNYIGKIIFSGLLPITQKDNKDKNHRLGLESIHKLVTRNGGYMNICTTDNIFNLQILLINK